MNVFEASLHSYQVGGLGGNCLGMCDTPAQLSENFEVFMDT